MNVRARLLTILIIIASLFLFSSFAVSYLTKRQTQTVDHLISNSSQALTILNGLVLQLQKSRRFEKEYIINVGHTSKKAKYYRDWKASMEKVFATLQLMLDNPDQLFNEEDNRLFKKWQKSAQFYSDEFYKIIETFSGVRSVGEEAERASSRYTARANSSIQEGVNRLNTVLSEIIEVEQRKEDELQYNWHKIKTQATNILLLTYAASAVGMLVMLIVMVKLYSSTINKFHMLIVKAKSMSQGDLSVYFDKTGIAELDTLSMAMENIKRRLLKSR